MFLCVSVLEPEPGQEQRAATRAALICILAMEVEF